MDTTAKKWGFIGATGNFKSSVLHSSGQICVPLQASKKQCLLLIEWHTSTYMGVSLICLRSNVECCCLTGVFSAAWLHGIIGSRSVRILLTDVIPVGNNICNKTMYKSVWLETLSWWNTKALALITYKDFNEDCFWKGRWRTFQNIPKLTWRSWVYTEV